MVVLIFCILFNLSWFFRIVSPMLLNNFRTELVTKEIVGGFMIYCKIWLKSLITFHLQCSRCILIVSKIIVAFPVGSVITETVDKSFNFMSRNIDFCSVFRSELIAIVKGLSFVNIANGLNFTGLLTLTDSHASIEHYEIRLKCRLNG